MRTCSRRCATCSASRRATCSSARRPSDGGNMPRPRKPWSKVVEEHGITVRLYERAGTISRSIVVNGRKDRKSLGHGHRDLAETQAKALCGELAKHRLDGTEPGGATFGHVRRLYLTQRGPI